RLAHRGAAEAYEPTRHQGQNDRAEESMSVRHKPPAISKSRTGAGGECGGGGDSRHGRSLPLQAAADTATDAMMAASGNARSGRRTPSRSADGSAVASERHIVRGKHQTSHGRPCPPPTASGPSKLAIKARD